MIREIVIRDFQSIGLLHLKMGAITILRGESRQGKSAVLRALRAVVTNPKGSSFIRSKAKSCEIIVKTDRGILQYEKERTGSASYTVQLGNDPPLETFRKVTEIPKEVLQILNIGDVPIDEDISIPLNFSNQHEPPFLLAPLWGTASAVAKSLGKITSVNRVSSAMRSCAGDLKEAKVKLSSTQEQMREALVQTQRYDGLQAQVELAARLEEVAAVVTSQAQGLDTTDPTEASTLLSAALGEKDRIALLNCIPFDAFSEAEILHAGFSKLSDELAQATQLQGESEKIFALRAQTERALEVAQEDMEKFVTSTKVCPLCDRPWSKEC